MSYFTRKVADDDGCLRLAIRWSEDNFALTVLKGTNAYNATISSGYLKEQAKLVKHDFAQYYANLKQYIEASNDEISIKLKTAKHVFEVHYIIGPKSSFKYFFVELQEASYYDCVENIVDTLNARNTESSLQLGNLKSENERLENELSKYKTKIEEFVNAKRLNDKQMLSNFVILLNEKKSRIQHLTELLDAFKSGREPANPVLKRTKKNGKTSKAEETAKKPKRELISESDSDEDSVTPEPMEEDYNSEEEKRKEIADLAVPSTSKADFSFLKENSPPRGIKIKPIIPEKKCFVTVKSETNTDPHKEQNAQPQLEEVTMTPTLDFNTQDMLDEL